MVQRGFYIGFSGVVTFKNAGPVREAARAVPLERVLAETDSPYCAPVPLRGTVNEPANVVHVIRRLAGLWGLAEDDVRRITTRNAAHLFGLPVAGGGPCLVYPIRRSLYVNVTNECSNRCTFCPRSGGELVVMGHDLRLAREATAEEILGALADARAGEYEEVVFCGFGEPTLRLDVVKTVARGAKDRWHKKARLNTNGQGSAINGRDIVPELAGLIDAASVSLDAPDAATYERLCRPTISNAFAAVCDFIRCAKGRIPEVRATAVAVPGLDLEAVRRLAEKELGVAFEVRAYNMVG
jgi:TatD DNase family protein